MCTLPQQNSCFHSSILGCWCRWTIHFRGSLGEDRLKHLHVMNCNHLTQWGRVTHICEQTIIGSDNGLSPGRRQAIIWTNTAILSTGPMETNFNEILIKIYTFSFKKMHLKTPSGKWRPSCLGLNELRWCLLSLIGPIWITDSFAGWII